MSNTWISFFATMCLITCDGLLFLMVLSINMCYLNCMFFLIVEISECRGRIGADELWDGDFTVVWYHIMYGCYVLFGHLICCPCMICGFYIFQILLVHFILCLVQYLWICLEDVRVLCCKKSKHLLFIQTVCQTRRRLKYLQDFKECYL